MIIHNIKYYGHDHGPTISSYYFIPSGKRLHNYRKSQFYSWVNPLFRLGHSQVRKLLVYQRVQSLSQVTHYPLPWSSCKIQCASQKKIYNTVTIWLFNIALENP